MAHLEAGGIITWLGVGAIAGWLTGNMSGLNQRLAGDVVLGIIGALVGGFLVNLVGTKVKRPSWRASS